MLHCPEGSAPAQKLVLLEGEIAVANAPDTALQFLLAPP
jgi:hypothetical protein